MKKTINMETYGKLEHFEYYRDMEYPYVSISVPVDISELISLAKARKDSLFIYLLYLAGRAANDIPEFRQRIEDGKIVEYDNCHSTYMVLKEDGTYSYCEADTSLPFAEFYEEAMKRKNSDTRHPRSSLEDQKSMFTMSCVPDLHYTGLTQPVRSLKDSAPCIAWGKYLEEVGRMVIPVSIQVHHALVDGKNIADFYGTFSAMAKDTMLFKK